MLHFVWRDYSSGNSDVYYKNSTDNGNTWSSSFRINDVSDYANNVVISCTGSNVHIIWNDQRNDTTNLYYIKSTNGGLTWGQNIRLVSNSTGAGSIASSYPYVYITWTDNRTSMSKIYFERSTDNGNSWDQEVSITNNSSASQFPSIGIDGANIHIVWNEQYSGYELHYIKSTDYGQTWGNDQTLVNALLPWVPTLSVSGQNIHLAYFLQTTNGNYNIYYKNSTNGGSSWNAQTRLTFDNYSQSPSIVSNGQSVQIAWRKFTAQDSGIYYLSSTNNGANWSSETEISTNSYNADNPSLAVSNSNLYAVWGDSKSGNSEIYFRRNPTANGIYSVSGLVTFKDNNQPVTSGFVKALKYDSATTEIITVDSTTINSNGTYLFSHIPEDVLDIMFYQDDDMLQFVPTYYVSTIDWREATKLNVIQNMTNINCQVYRINNTANPYNISGQITANVDNPVITSMKDAIVYAKIGDTFKNFGISNGSGLYITTKLPPGSYNLIAHRMGFAPVSQNLTITNSNLSNINFDLGNPLIGISLINENIPKTYSLSQNYPNPFNPATTIRFALPQSGLVKLSVYDVLGREVESLIEENLAAGTYSFNWNASNYPSGIYFYRFVSKDFSETKKMVLIK